MQEKSNRISSKRISDRNKKTGCVGVHNFSHYVKKALSIILLILICITLQSIPVYAAKVSNNMFIYKNNKDKIEKDTDYKVKIIGTITNNNLIYKQILGKKRKLQLVRSVNKNSLTSIIIPSSIIVCGYTYEIISVADNAFKGDTKLKKLKIGANIEHIGKNAFKNCKNLKKITIKSNKLTFERIGDNAFKNINSNAVIKTPKDLPTINLLTVPKGRAHFKHFTKRQLLESAGA